MTRSRAALWLPAAAAVLAAACAACGLFWPAGGEQFQFLTVHGVPVTIHGSGLYRFDTPVAALGFRGADLVTLFAAVPILAVSVVLHARGSRRAAHVAAGALVYLVYNYASMAFGASYNSLFIGYLAVLATGLLGLLAVLRGIDGEEIADRFGPSRPARGAGIFLVVCGAILALIWLGLSIVPALLAGTVAPEAVYSTTFVTGALDTAIVGPLLAAAGILVLRRRPLGYRVLPAVLVFPCIIGPTLAVGGILQLASGVITPGQAGAMTAPFVALTIAAAVFAAGVFRRLGPSGGRK
jgi:hypothetical protein